MSARPQIEAVRDAGLGFFGVAPLFRLEADYVFRLAVKIEGCDPEFLIPAGYEFDKASIPRLFWGPPLNYLPDGLCTVPALEHDFLCDLLMGGSDWLRRALGGSLPPVPPAWAVHEHFRRRLHQCGVRPAKAEAMGRTVEVFGPMGLWQRGNSWLQLAREIWRLALSAWRCRRGL